MAKLHIPAPGEKRPEQHFADDIFFVTVVTLAVMVVLYVGVTHEERVRGERQEDKTAEQLSPQQELAEQLDKVAPEMLAKKADWKSDELLAALVEGKAKSSEAACEHLKDKIGNGELSREAHAALLKRLSRRDPQAPWACLLKLYHGGAIHSSLKLGEEMREFWEQSQWFNVDTSPTMYRALRRFHEQRERPKGEEFAAWLRVCAFQTKYEPSGLCRQLLYQVAPEQGADLVMVAEHHMRSKQFDPDRDLPIIARGLGTLVRLGHPNFWPLKGELQGEKMRPYPFEVREGAVYVLCRLATSPSNNVASTAAEALGHAANTGARATDDLMLRRWLETCQKIFDQGAARAEGEFIPLLSVRREDKSVAYPLAALVERGDCQVPKGQPLWTCGTQIWEPKKDESLSEALLMQFIESRHLEWEN